MADNYNPVQTQSPSLSSGDNLLSVRATPEDFGAQVGQATQQLGKTVEQAGTNQYEVEMIRQGQTNETAIANAETTLNSTYGELEGQYKSLKGAAYQAAHPEYVQKVQQARQDVVSTLPNDATKRAFNIAAARTEGFVLRDAGNYLGTQIKQADNESTAALMRQSIDNTARYSVATDDREFGFQLGQIKSAAEHLTQNQGWDLKTQQGQDVYNQFLDKAKDQVYTNVVKTLADDPQHGDVGKAVQYLEQNKDQMPAVTYAKLSQTLAPQYRSMQTANIATDTLAKADQNYTKSVTSISHLLSPTDQPKVFQGVPYKGTAEAPDISTLGDRFIQQESGFKGDNLGQIQPSTWARYAKPGEEISDPIDNRNVMNRLLSQYAKDYHGDLSRIAVAYFSGPGNISDAGNPLPFKENHQDKNGKFTSDYVSDITGVNHPDWNGTSKDTQPPVYFTKAEYYEQNKGTIMDDARKRANDMFPGRPEMADAAASRTEQHINDVIQQENGKKAADSELVRRSVFGDEQHPGITNVSQLETAAPEIRDAWHRMEITNPLGAEALRTKVITANSKGKQLTYGTDFWKHFQSIADGKVTNASQLYNYVGSDRNSPLTNTGLAQLAKEIQGQQTPEGQAFMHSEKQYFEGMRNEIVGGLDVHNANGEAIFQRAMIQALPKIQAGKAAGKSSGELFDKESPDYVGGAADYDRRTLAQKIQDSVTVQSPMPMNTLLPNQTPVKPFDIKSLDAITDKTKAKELISTHMKDKKITPEEYDNLLQYSIKRGWVQSPAPTVPNAIH